jgi:hypothetical protein
MASVRPPHTWRPNRTILLLSSDSERSDDEETKWVTSCTANVMREATLCPCRLAEALAASSDGAWASIMWTLRFGTHLTRLIARSPRPPPMSKATHPEPSSSEIASASLQSTSSVQYQGEISASRSV